MDYITSDLHPEFNYPEVTDAKGINYAGVKVEVKLEPEEEENLNAVDERREGESAHEYITPDYHPEFNHPEVTDDGVSIYAGVKVEVLMLLTVKYC